MWLGCQSEPGAAEATEVMLQRPAAEAVLPCQRNSEGQTEVGPEKSEHTIPVARKHAAVG